MEILRLCCIQNAAPSLDLSKAVFCHFSAKSLFTFYKVLEFISDCLRSTAAGDASN